MRSARMPIGDIAYFYRTPTKTMWRGGVMRADSHVRTMDL